MARTGRAYPGHPIIFRPKVGGATPPSTPRSRTPVVVTASLAMAKRQQRKLAPPIIRRGPVPLTIVVALPRRPYVFQARNVRSVRDTPPPIAARAAALADIILPRPPVLVVQARARRARSPLKPIITALRALPLPFVRPPLPTIVGPVARAKRRILGEILIRRGKLPVAAGTLVNTAPPVVSGPTLVLNTLTTTDGSWTGTAPITFAYQWQRETAVGSGVYVDIAGQTTNTYFTILIDVGLRIDCVVTATNPLGSLSQGSNKLGPITAPDVNAFRRLRELPGFIVRN